ncbi:MAG: MlaD family protein, partial [Nitrospinales bacterium]
MEYRSSEIKAGLFIFISLIVLCAMIFLLKDLKDIGKTKRTLEIQFENASGLTTGLPVTYAGIKIGRITAIIEKDDEKYHVAAVTEINQDKTIFEKDRAYIKTEGLMGGPYIDIEPGPSKEPFPENVPMKGNPAFSFASIGTKLEKFGSLFDGMGDLDLSGTLNSMKETFDNAKVILKENRQPIAKSIDNIRKASGNLNDVFNKKNRETFAATLENFKEAAGRVSEALNENNREAFAVALTNFGEATGNLRDALNQSNQEAFAATLRNLEDVSANANGILVENRQPIADSINNMKGTFKTANTILEENRQPISDSINNIKGTFRTATDLLEENRQPIKDSVNSMNGAFKTADSILKENRRP